MYPSSCAFELAAFGPKAARAGVRATGTGRRDPLGPTCVPQRRWAERRDRDTLAGWRSGILIFSVGYDGSSR
jgi:hypothetical protein